MRASPADTSVARRPSRFSRPAGTITFRRKKEHHIDIVTISLDELKTKLDRGDDFKLVMTLHQWAFDAAHIPGSISVTSPGEAAEHLTPSDEIIVYCSDVHCVASQLAYRALKEAGFENVRRFAGGLSEWEANGLPLDSRSAVD